MRAEINLFETRDFFGQNSNVSKDYMYHAKRLLNGS